MSILPAIVKITIMRNLIILLFSFVILLSSLNALADITINNKSEYAVVITIKDEEFKSIEKFKLQPLTVFKYALPNQDYGKYLNIEAYELNPNDPTLSPSFFHEVMNKSKICLPIRLCNEKKK